MSISPIQINIEDIKKFAYVALFVDKDAFLEDVQSARDKLKMIQILSRPDAEKTEIERIKKTTDDIKEQLRQLPIYQNGSKILRFNIDNNLVIHDDDTQLDDIITSLLKKYHKSRLYYTVIKFSILCNMVEEKDFIEDLPSRTYVSIGVHRASPYLIPPPAKGETKTIELNDTEAAIVINPETTKEEISQLFNTFHKKCIKVGGNQWIVLDTLGNIKRDREWYWMKKKEDSSYGDIWKKAQEQGLTITRDGIIKAIKQYDKFLAMEV